MNAEELKLRLDRGEPIDVRGDGKAGGGLVLAMQAFGGALAAYVDCQPSPEVSAGAMEPLMEAVASAQASGALRAEPVEEVAFAIWGQVHGLVSLELAQVGPPGADWAAAYNSALDAIARGWAA